MAAVKSTREWGESGREATATLTNTQIHKHTIKQIQIKDKYNHYPVSSKTSNPSIREHVQSGWDKLKRRTTFVKILMLTWDGWKALSWVQVWKFYKCPCNPRRVAFVPPVCPTVKLFCILHIPRKYFCYLYFFTSSDFSARAAFISSSDAAFPRPPWGKDPREILASLIYHHYTYLKSRANIINNQYWQVTIFPGT